MLANNALHRTVIRRRVRAPSTPFHYAVAARWTEQRAVAQRRRWVAKRAGSISGIDHV
jgi:hypothetical protein